MLLIRNKGAVVTMVVPPFPFPLGIQRPLGSCADVFENETFLAASGNGRLFFPTRREREKKSYGEEKADQDIVGGKEHR